MLPPFSRFKTKPGQQPASRVTHGKLGSDTGLEQIALFWILHGCLLGLRFDPKDEGNTSVNFYHTTLHHIPENNVLHSYYHENLKSNGTE
jgi:hypothetical protein